MDRMYISILETMADAAYVIAFPIGARPARGSMSACMRSFASLPPLELRAPDQMEYPRDQVTLVRGLVGNRRRFDPDLSISSSSFMCVS